jgi:aspartyl-tRNA(Asn)/glutamyl-tRNA(Gln) amidotransferase subunit A
VSNDLVFLPATTLLDMFRSKETSPVEVTRAVLDQLRKLNPKLNALNLVDEPGALASAEASSTRWAKGKPKGKLDGIPVSIKDILLTKGWPTLRGSKLVDPNQAWSEDAPCTARLREAGAVFLGKTTSPEFGWKALGDSPLTGITRNPWNLEHTSGGSSAGAAAAVAAGIGPMTMGTDGGGSIRIPSAFCGIFGLKPTFGRVPAYPLSPFGALAHLGPMTRTVADGALMMNVIAQHDPRDPWSVPRDRVDFLKGIDDGVRGVKVGYSPTLGYAKVDPEIRTALDHAAQRFTELGAQVDTIDPGFANPHDAFLVLWCSGAAKIVSGFPPEKRGVMDPGLLASAEIGFKHSAVDYLNADAVRNEVCRAMIQFHETYDLLLTPAVPVPALPVSQDLNAPGETHWIDWTPFSYPFNMTRQPAASVPCGLTHEGLPIGLQLVGRYHEDALVLRAAQAFESTQPAMRPPI